MKRKLLALLLACLMLSSTLIMFSSCSSSGDEIKIWFGGSLLGLNESEEAEETWIINQLLNEYEELNNVTINATYFEDEEAMVQLIENNSKSGGEVPDIACFYSSEIVRDMADIIYPIKTHITDDEKNNILYWETVTDNGKSFDESTEILGIPVNGAEVTFMAYLHLNGKYICADGTISDVKAVIDKHFNGNGLDYARNYYETLSLLPDRGKIDIIGHFDLITKHLEREALFDTQTKEYQNIVISTLETLSGKIPFFEVNTGAIANGYRTTPYPSLFVLQQLKRLGFGAIISSDCHDCTFLDYGFDKAKEWLKIAGFDEYYVLTVNGFVPIKI